ncbi:MAG: ABC transporter substrate-binding protein, partial [Bifidobacteriaceae bacterium]|nr:ABC transporter substrate-binding protein [Bifidobacteriaceae bacterium]
EPPDSFQAHTGAELLEYANNHQAQDISGLYQEFGLNEALPAGLLDLVTTDGQRYSIPLNARRVNVLWASIPALERAGIDPDGIGYASYADFFEDLDRIKAADPEIVPLALGTTWTQVHLLETVLMAELGPEAYNGLWNGATDPAGPAVGAALAVFAKALTYTNADAEDHDWAGPIEMLCDGRAAFSVTGDWAASLFDSQSKVMGADWAWAPAPGSAGVYGFMGDSFALPYGPAHPDGAEAWLEVVASAQGQAAFSLAAGSIPARTDADLSGFSEYQKQAAESYAADIILGSIYHGAAATAAQSAAITDAVGRYRADGDLAALQTEFADAIVLAA